MNLLLKKRYANHKTSFTNRDYAGKTELSNYIWDLKNKGIEDFSIKFSILKKSVPFRAGSSKCNLCLWEKLYIMKGKDLMYEKDELVSKCRHINKFLLRNFKYKNK